MKIRKRRLLAPAFLAVAISSIVPESQAYVFEGPRWPAGSLVALQLGLGAAGRVLLDGNTTWDGAAKPAADPWNQVLGPLRLQLNLTLNPPVALGDRVNSIVFSSDIFGQAFDARTLAVTVIQFRRNTMVEADVLFNNQQSFDSYRGPLHLGQNPVYDIQRVMIHELGHVIGLGHPDTHGQNVQAIMNSIISDRDSLSSDDIAGARALYSSPARDLTTRTDFNSDGFADYLLFNGTTHQTAIWHLQNGTFLDGIYGPALPAGWTVACVADINLDGRSDYVLFNPRTHQTAIWFLNNAAFTSSAWGPTLPAGWTLIAAADANADAQPDYILFNPSTHETMAWFLDGVSQLDDSPGPALPAGWTLVDATDVDGDGQLDFVLFHASTRRTAIWYLNHGILARSAYGPTLPAGWILQGLDDFNHDGHQDYLLLNSATRRTAIWFLNGVNVQRGVYGPTVAAGYRLVSP